MMIFLRITELRNSIIHYKNDIIVLKDRIIEIENLKNNILIKIKRIQQKIKNMKYNKERCDNCKIDIDRAF